MGSKMKAKHFSHSYVVLSLFLSILLLSPTVASDAPPGVSIKVEPSHAGVGDTVVVTADASDDLGVQEIYFYFPPSPEFVFESCAGNPSCSKSISRVIDTVGIKTFCAKAIDTSGNLSDLQCTTVDVSSDRPPVIKYFYAEPTKGDIPTVHVGGVVQFTVVAKDDVGVTQIFFENVSEGVVDVHKCGSRKTCIYNYQEIFNETGVFEFCTWANDTIGQTSDKSCIHVHVTPKYGCELITLDDTVRERVIALRLTSGRLHHDRDGLIGYPAHCCKDHGFCDDLEIDMRNCSMIRGSFPSSDYRVFRWNPHEISLEELLSDYKYPQILCTNTLDDYTLLGVIDGGDINGTSASFEPPGDDSTHGRAVFDSSHLRFITGIGPGPGDCDNSPYVLNTAEWLDNGGKTVLLYGSGDDPVPKFDELKSLLEGEGYTVTAMERSGSDITGDLLTNYGQVWFIDTIISITTPLTQAEIDAVADYHDNGGNILLSGEDCGYACFTDMVDAISQGVFNVTMGSSLDTSALIDADWCVAPTFIPHPVGNGISKLSSSTSDILLSTTNPDVESIATLGGEDYIMVLDASTTTTTSTTTTSTTTTSTLLPHGGGYQLVAGTQNLEENVAIYWTIKVEEEGKDKYFFAEQLQQEENETKVSIIVDAGAYSDAVHTLLEAECLEKDLESGECQFDCPKDASYRWPEKCDYSCICGGGMALGCGYCRPQTCECCMQCHKLYNYKEHVYRKYEKMYGRPYVDYLFCSRIPGLKDTPWCYQKSDQPTSAVNFPWYGFTRKEDDTVRSLDLITDEYIDEIYKWNWNAEVREKPARSGISEKLWPPETYCDHNFESKLFRSIWVKVFTSTPLLHDRRNLVDWTRTGDGAAYLGGGFRREPACWWECCRKCAPYCNCDCVPCMGYCCLNAHYTSGVKVVMEIRIPYVLISDGPISVTPNNPEQTSWTLNNTALTVISTGNMPYKIKVESFTKDEDKGVYILTQEYIPTGGWSDNKNFVADYDQFVITEDIVLKYQLKENAKHFSVSIKEDFTTSLVVLKCSCYKPPLSLICHCLSSGAEYIETSESVHDGIGSTGDIDTIKIKALKEAAKGFIDIVTPETNVGLVAFSHCGPCCSPGGVCWWMGLTTDASSLNKHIATYYKPMSGTCISCGIHKGRGILKDAVGEKYLVVMSDGVPQCCLSRGYECGQDAAKAQALAQATAAKGEGITVHAVALGDGADNELMKNLAEAGGGVFYKVTCDCLLDCIYTELAGLVKDNAVLVNDVSGSMEWPLTLKCPGVGIPVIHEFGILNLSITGNIDTYIDESMTTGVKSKGFIWINATPDIINRFLFNVENSSIDYYSLVYPIQHEAFRKHYAWGYWEPGDPYTETGKEYGNLEGVRKYIFNDSYGYEDPYFNYPKQCKEICPADCTCPKEDITDVTCVAKNGSVYKRTDCVCLPPMGHSYKTPCTSDRTFHEEEGYYFDFTDLETKEVSEIGLMGKRGTNPVFRGNLKGNVTHGVTVEKFDTSYIYIANSRDNTVSKVSTHDCTEVCTYDVGASPSRTAVDLKGEVWVANRDSKDVTRLDGDSCRVIDTYPVGNGPRPIVADDDNNIWVGNARDNNVWKLNGTSGECIIGDPARNPTCPADSSPIPVGNNPYGGVYDCNGHVWIICTGDDRLFKIRTSDGVVVSPAGGYRVGGDTYGIAIDTDGNIWLGGSGSGNVYKVDGATGSILCQEKISGYTRGLVVDEYNNPWVADHTANEVIHVDGSNCQVLGRYGVGSGPIGVTIDADGNVWGVNRESDDAVKLNGSDGSYLCTAQVGDEPYTYSDMSGHNIWKICHNKTLKYERVKEVRGGYLLDFEAIEFPYSLVKYKKREWYDAVKGENCSTLCRDLGLYSVPVCDCAYWGSTGKCIKCKQGTYVECRDDCTRSCEDAWDSQQCCCATPYMAFENATMTIFIHFRDNVEDQTFPLFPPRTESKPYADIYINVTMRNPSKVICVAKPDSTKPRGGFIVNVTLLNALNGTGISGENVTIYFEAYNVYSKVTTDSDGKAEFMFKTTEQGTKIKCMYEGNAIYTSSEDSSYVNVYSLDRFWWFLSPEVLLLLIILILLAFSYKWFRGGRLNIYDMWDELRGRK